MMSKTMNTRNHDQESCGNALTRHQILLSLSFEELQHLTEENEQGRRESIRVAGR